MTIDSGMYGQFTTTVRDVTSGDPAYTAQHVDANTLDGGGDVGLTNRIDLSTFSFDAGTSTGCLTPDALMTYCSCRLQSLDGQIQDAMKKQQTSVAEQKLIDELLPELQSMQDKGTTQADGTAGANATQCQQLESDVEAVIKKIHEMDPNSAALGPLESLHDKIMATGSGPFDDANGNHHDFYAPNAANSSTNHDNIISAEEMQGFVKDLESANSAINSNAELTMINVQSLMSQRQTAVQLTTNLVQSLGDQLNKIADNIGH